MMTEMKWMIYACGFLPRRDGAKIRKFFPVSHGQA
jgi:hypothetical protein